VEPTELAAAATGAITCAVGLTAGGRYVVGAQAADVLVFEQQGRLWAVSAENATITPQPSVDKGRRLSAVEFDTTVGYVTQCHQFGKPVGGYQAVKHHLADVRIAIEFTAPLVYRAAWVVANPDSASASEGRVAVSMAKAMASDAVDKSCRAALQCHGVMPATTAIGWPERSVSEPAMNRPVTHLG